MKRCDCHTGTILCAECGGVVAVARRRATKRLAPGKSKAERKAEKRQRRHVVRAQVAARADGRCECGCGTFVGAERLHMDHFWGRSREESVESCWMLSPECDRDKTENKPNRASWIFAFGVHCTKYGYSEQVKKVHSALGLERAQHPEHEETGT